MIDIGFTQLAAAQIVLLIISVIWFIRRNDELPLILCGVMLYCSSYRYWAVTNGLGDWINIYQPVIGRVTEENAIKVLRYIVLGQAVLIGTYMYRQKHVLTVSSIIENPQLLRWLRLRVIILSLICIPLIGWTRSLVEAQLLEGPSVLEVSSYLILFPLAMVGISILNIALWKAGGYPSILLKLAGAVVLVCVAYLTFSPQLRFQFLGWISGAAIIISANYSFKKRVLLLAVMAVLGVAVFVFAGSLREDEFSRDQAAGPQRALDRVISATDANMLDGFVMLDQVYPDMLDYTWGMDHLEILTRPIPRSLWPDKPLVGYANQLGLYDYYSGTTGISPSLFGSFYEEGGIFGIVLFSILYGAGLAAIMGHTMRVRPFASFIIRAVVCASLVPMLRGGDLGGGYAWIGMAYWPCFLLLWLKRDKLRMRAAPALLGARVKLPGSLKQWVGGSLRSSGIARAVGPRSK
jgi:hypothetical protein